VITVRSRVPLLVLALLCTLVAGAGVTAAAGAPSPASPRAGARDAADRSEAEARANLRAVGRWLRARPDARRVLAGEWLVLSPDRGESHVSFAANAARYETSLRRVVPHPERLVVHPALWSLRELRRLQDRVVRDQALLRRLGVLVTAVGVDVRHNLVQVGIDRASAPHATRVLRRRYAGGGGLGVEFLRGALRASARR
jgi:hypothetical protein